MTADNKKMLIFAMYYNVTITSIMKNQIKISLLAMVLIFSATTVQGQNKGKNTKGKNKPAVQEVQNVELSANSNDCLFAIELQRLRLVPAATRK